MTAKRLKAQSLETVAKDWGIDFQVLKTKSELVAVIKSHCLKHAISQRMLARIVPGLIQDRVSKIFSGQVGHMTIDKLVAILTALKFKITFDVRPARVNTE